MNGVTRQDDSHAGTASLRSGPMQRLGLGWVDAMVTAIVLTILQLEVWVPLGHGFANAVGPRPVFSVVLVAASVALLWRRTKPLAVVALVAGLLVAYYLAYGAPDGLATLLLPAVGLYSAGRYGSTTSLAAGTGITAVSLAVHQLRDPQPSLPVGPTILFIAAVLGTGILGRVLANRSRAIGDLSRTAAFLERERAERVAAAVEAERDRIARELHDIVGHGISLMVLQVEGAQAGLEKGRLDLVGERLDRMSTTARQTMAEMRRLLAVIGDEEAPLHPQLGIDDVEALVERIRDEGMPVEFRGIESGGADVPASVGIAVYRIVQEALTNVVKHAGPRTPTQVRLARTGNALTMAITDSGAGSGPDFTIGRGLAGMRERVTVLGGTIEYGDCAGGGFAVRATLPIAGSVR